MTDQTVTAIELLTFRLADEEYALDIMSVREIRGWTHATSMPHAPGYMKGVINLRGTVLPVIDLAQRLGMPNRPADGRNVIIVASLGEAITGLLVDGVSDIVQMTEADLQPPPDLSAAQTENVVQALMLIDDRMIRLLDLGATLARPESTAA
ncbi:MAG: chemotaxis protein CheW [Sulfitobacter sp.]|nr:chemotaxis protein CheW [Sulfitobacter sp.]